MNRLHPLTDMRVCDLEHILKTMKAHKCNGLIIKDIQIVLDNSKDVAINKENQDKITPQLNNPYSL